MILDDGGDACCCCISVPGLKKTSMCSARHRAKKKSRCLIQSRRHSSAIEVVLDVSSRSRVTEETTTGVHRLYDMHKRVNWRSRRSTSTTQSPKATTTCTAAASRWWTPSSAPPMSWSLARLRWCAATATWAKARRTARTVGAGVGQEATRSARCRRRWKATASSPWITPRTRRTSSSRPPATST